MAKAGVGDILRFLFRKQLAQEAGDRSDGDLLKQFAATREDRPFTVLFERHAPMVMGVCKRILGDFHQAEDSLQATFHILARRAGSVRWRECLGPWLYAVARRVALRARAKRLAQQNLERRLANMPPSATIDDAAWNDLSSVLDEEIGRLPAKYRAPLILTYLESKSRSRVAKELGWPEGTVARRLERARELLRLRLVKRGVTLSAGALGVALVEKVAAAPVPTMLAINTIKAATTVVAGQAAGGGFISAQALILAEETMKGMLFVKAKLVLLALTVSVALGGAGWAGYQAIAKPAQSAPVVKGQENVKVKEAVDTDMYGDPLPDGAVGRLGTVRFRHDGEGTSVAYAENGKTLVVKTRLGFELLDVATGNRRPGLNRLPLGYSYLISSLKFSPAGKKVSSGQFVGNFEKYIAVAPDGTVLAIPEKTVANKEIVIGFWDLSANKKTQTVSIPVEDNPNGPKAIASDAIKIQYLTFGADGRSVAVAYTKARQAGKATVFNRETGKTLITFGNEEGPFTFLGIAPDGKTIAASSGSYDVNQLQIRDMATGKIIHSLLENSLGKTINPPTSEFIAFSSDSKMLAARNAKNRVCIFDVATGKEVSQLNPANLGKSQSLFFGLRFTKDNKQILSCEAPGIVQRWDLSTREIVQTFKITGAIQEPKALAGFAFAPDLKTIAFGYNWGSRISIWDLTTGDELFTKFQGHNEQVSQLSFVPKSNLLVSLSTLGKAFLWDFESKEKKEIVPGSHTSLSFSKDGRKFASISDGRIQVQGVVADGKKPLTIALPESAIGESAHFSSDGKKLFTLETQDPATDKKAKKQPIFVGKTTPIKRFVRRWDLAMGQEENVLEIPNQNQVGGLQKPAPILSFDAKTVFMEIDMPAEKKMTSIVTRSQSSDVNVYFSTVGTSRLLRGREEEAGDAMMPSPDARIVASAFSSPVTIRLNLPLFNNSSKKISYGIRFWEVMTGKEILVLKGQHDFVDQMAWSEDGRFVACPDKIPSKDDEHGIGSPFRILVWDSATGKQVAHFDDIAANITALAFSPDAKYLAVALGDTSILLYDLRKIDPKFRPAPKLAMSALEACWADLAGDNATLAYRAVGTFVLAPKDVVPFFHVHLKPVPAVDPAKVQKWIADLNSEILTVRQTAAREMEKAGEQATAPMQTELQKQPHLEIRRRLEQILKAIFDNPSPNTVRTIRAIMALERIGSPDAQSVLETLARGAPGARETEEARASLERLTMRAAKVP